MKNTVWKAAILCAGLLTCMQVSAQDNSKEITTDPVCGMPVKKAESFEWKYKNTVYYFDSYDCRETFKARPQTFLLNKCVMNDTLIDPVCGVKVDLSESFDSKFEGRVYHFHNVSCKEAFKMNPKKFIANYCAPKVSVK